MWHFMPSQRSWATVGHNKFKGLTPVLGSLTFTGFLSHCFLWISRRPGLPVPLSHHRTPELARSTEFPFEATGLQMSGLVTAFRIVV